MAPPSGKRPAVASKSTAQKRPLIDSPQIIGSYTSYASRKRRRPVCSMESLRELEDEVSLEADFIGYFGATAESHWTWGKTETQPILATKKKGRAPRFKKTAADSAFATQVGREDPLCLRIPNSPVRTAASHISLHRLTSDGTLRFINGCSLTLKPL